MAMDAINDDDERASAWKSLIADLEVECLAPPPPEPAKATIVSHTPPPVAVVTDSSMTLALQQQANRQSHLPSSSNSQYVNSFSLGVSSSGPHNSSSSLRSKAHSRLGGGSRARLSNNKATLQQKNNGTNNELLQQSNGGNGLLLEKLPTTPTTTSLARQVSPPGQKPPPPPPLPCTLPLRDWVSYYAEQRRLRVKLNGVGTVMKKCTSWRGTTNTNGSSSSADGNKEADKAYLEHAVRVALSLALKLLKQKQQQQSSSTATTDDNNNMLIHERDITIDNIVVINTEIGEADFIRTSNNASRTNNSRDAERSEIYALGRLFYEIFTRGSKSLPPPRRTSGETTTVSSTSSSSIGNVLSMSENENNSGDGSDEQDEQTRHQRQRREQNYGEQQPGGSNGQSIKDTLQSEGMPSSICRLLIDMLQNEDGSLFCNESAMSSMEDVVSDLQQMNQSPKSFLHDSLLLRWKPVVPDRLYCKDKELKEALDVAERVFSSCCGDNGHDKNVSGEEILDDPSMNDMMYPHDMQQILMISGHSGK